MRIAEAKKLLVIKLISIPKPDFDFKTGLNLNCFYFFLKQFLKAGHEIFETFMDFMEIHSEANQNQVVKLYF